MATSNITTPKVRLVFPKLYHPESIEAGGKLKYSCALLFAKDDQATVQIIQDAINAAMTTGANNLVNKTTGQWHNNLKLPLRDGDEKAAEFPEYGGHWYINCYSDKQPFLCDQNRNLLHENSPNNLYSGCYVAAAINFYAFSSATSRGVAVGLNGVQKWADGEDLSGANFNPEQAFSVIPSSEYPPMQSSNPEAPQYGQQPPAAPAQQYAPPAQQYAPPVQPGAPAPQYAPPVDPAQQYQQPPAAPAQQYAPPAQPGAPAPQYAPPAQQYAPPAPPAQPGAPAQQDPNTPPWLRQ